jgi:hypothetical protein
MKSHFYLCPSTHCASRSAYKAGLAVHLPVKIRWQSKKLQIQGAQILRNEAYLPYAAVTKDAVQRSPSALLRAMSPSTLLRTVSLSNGLSNGSWTFYEAINKGEEKQEGTE